MGAVRRNKAEKPSTSTKCHRAQFSWIFRQQFYLRFTVYGAAAGGPASDLVQCWSVVWLCFMQFVSPGIT